ncbi:unnamed protein product [Discosporangium mesarthrocarpum]
MWQCGPAAHASVCVALKSLSLVKFNLKSLVRFNLKLPLEAFILWKYCSALLLNLPTSTLAVSDHSCLAETSKWCGVVRVRVRVWKCLSNECHDTWKDQSLYSCVG